MLSDLIVVVPAASSKALLQNAPRAVPLLGVPCVVVPVETSRYFGQATGRVKKKTPKTNTFVYSCVQFSLHRAPSAGCCVLPGFGSSLCEGLCVLAFISGDPSLPGDGGRLRAPEIPRGNTLWQVVVAGQGGNQNSREGCMGRQPRGCERLGNASMSCMRVACPAIYIGAAEMLSGPAAAVLTSAYCHSERPLRDAAALASASVSGFL